MHTSIPESGTPEMESKGLQAVLGHLGAEDSNNRRIFRVRALRGAWTFTRQKPLGAAGVFVIIVFCLVAALADVIAQSDPNDINPDALLQAPGSDAWFGTDNLGRTCTRAWFMVRVSPSSSAS